MMTEEPGSDAPEAIYRNGLKQGHVMLQRCEESGRYFFYPRTISPFSGTARFTWHRASGDGVVYATTVVRQKPERGGDYNLALIDLAEGPRLMSRVEGIAPAEVAIGMAVTAFVGADEHGEPLLLFRPAEQPDA